MTMIVHLLLMLLAISVVYAGTRYERPAAIAVTAVRTFLQVVLAFGVVLAGLFVLSYRL